MTELTAFERRDLEFAVLRLLCQRTLEPQDSELFLGDIDPALFSEPSHRVVYEEVRALSALPFERLRELLPARVTKRGIPDFDFRALLEKTPLQGQELQDAVAALRVLRGEKEGPKLKQRSARGAGLSQSLTKPLVFSARSLPILDALAFSAFTAWYIWRLQETHPRSWIVFAVWLMASFAIHRDTRKAIGWRADNLWPATRRAAMVFGVFILGVCLAGLFLGALHRLPEHLIYPRRFASYLAFCLLQQVALQSFLMNRLLAAIGSGRIAALFAGAIFAALHWPNPVLVPLTFVGGTAMCWLFARERNILPLALGQAILGALVWWAFPLAWHHAMRVGPGFYTYFH